MLVFFENFLQELSPITCGEYFFPLLNEIYGFIALLGMMK